MKKLINAICLAAILLTCAACSAGAPDATATPEPSATITSVPTNEPTPTPGTQSEPVDLRQITCDSFDSLVQTGQIGGGNGQSIAWSPDGKYIAVGTSLGLHLYDAGTLEELFFKKTSIRVYDLEFSADGSRLAYVSENSGLVDIVSIPQGGWVTSVSTGTISASPATDVAISQDGKYLAAYGSSGALFVWSAQDSGEYKLEMMEDPESSYTDFVFAMGGKSLITITPRTMQLINLDGGLMYEAFNLARSVDLGGDHFAYLAVSRDGSKVAAASSTGDIQIRDAETGDLRNTIHISSADIRSIEFSTDGNRVIAGLTDGSIEVRTTHSGTLEHTIHLEDYSIMDLSLSPDGNALAVISWDGILRILHYPDLAVQETVGDVVGVPQAIDYSADGTVLGVLSQDGSIRFWDSHTGRHISTFPLTSPQATALSFLPGGTDLLVGYVDGSLLALNINDATILQSIPGNGSSITNLLDSPDGKLLAAADEAGYVRVYDLEDYSLIQSYFSAAEPVNVIDFSPDGLLLAAGSDNGNTYIWNLAATQIMQTLPGDSSVDVVRFSPDQSQLVTGSIGEIYFWQTADWTTTEYPSTGVGEGLLFLPHSSCMIYQDLGMYITSLAMDDISSQNDQPLYLDQYQPMIFSILLRLDEQQIATGGYDGTVRFWGIH